MPIGFAMGTSPSKEEPQITIGKDRDTKSKTKSKVDTAPSSFDDSDETTNMPISEKSRDAHVMSTTPRTNPKSVSAYGAQNKANKSLGNGVADRRDDVTHARIRDEQVHVNLAMADLMAYLQVVANNSNNLPLTRRDDPELSKMVTNLASEEYARKSAAFIPADVRVIGGTFLKYGRVWDLPTSEEYNATDGAQEPGRSYGGACSNAMLKVLYDAANEGEDAAQTMEASEALFDDDEDEESLVTNNLPFTRNGTFASIDMNDHCNPSTISWASLLRKMKAETKEIEFAQVPTLTTTRKFDLNQPFSLTPEDFDKTTGKKRSLLIGCNYSHIHGAQLKAGHDDVRSMKDYIVNVHGFPEDDELMTVLLDDDEHKHPTFLNITEAFKALSEQSQPGDAVFIQFSGHGGRVLDSPVDSEAESYDEVIAPSDYANCGLIRDTLIFKTLLAPMRYGVTVTVLIDTCDTGMVLELPYAWSTRMDRPESIAKMIQNDDYSFVRFLKVVKTLYESSTFTQLGKTVGSALSTQPPLGADDDGTHLYTNDSRTEDDSFKRSSRSKDQSNSFLSMLCGSPPEEEADKVEDAPKKSKKNRKSGHDRDGATVDTRETRGNPSLLEQVMNCTLGHGDEMSDEDTYKSNGSYDEHSVEEDSTFDSMTDHDEAYETSKRARGRSRRRRV
mmetsp:Transcript_14434/g.22694  ORF Transcript_14434/g.22694 Transcript_14434/m.22694 type:complete len:673 (-) Transcript_14434:104-2122(-)|eukprot:CAMPEP_0117020972 /NCGR_PEP_ID=MMETSP0472-20121206/15876_1 /TAXON_ID=693140 ORGANISM="Tiarina fusus, Strain LIS" /NCGR_SAMPLE_ID=MMETSP0472 /ASSEMBLY_ACC=CAM_ASM_000603 /LENGTH=672 /DNA_ID=CAMNT_0004726323 /DNA_START=75 /DNA_END=2093 /DNA_ORIENTATION=-